MNSQEESSLEKGVSNWLYVGRCIMKVLEDCIERGIGLSEAFLRRHGYRSQRFNDAWPTIIGIIIGRSNRIEIHGIGVKALEGSFRCLKHDIGTATLMCKLSESFSTSRQRTSFIQRALATASYPLDCSVLLSVHENFPWTVLMKRSNVLGSS